MTVEMIKSVVITAPMEAAVHEIKQWSPQPDELLIRCKAAAICTTERLIFSGHRRVYPAIGGHEFAGVVEWVGENESGLNVGDRVAIDAVRRCGRCYYCLKGFSNQCVEMRKRKLRNDFVLIGGGFAQYTVAPAARAFRLSAAASLEEASLIEPLACCAHSVKKARIDFGDTVAIIGAGTMGILHLMLLNLLGARVVMVDVDQDRLDFAKGMGAAEIVDARRCDPTRSAQDLTEGRGVDAVFVTANSEAAGGQALAMVGRLGSVVFYSSQYPSGTLNLDWNRIHYEEITITGAQGKTDKDFHEAVRLFSNGQVSLGPLISKTISLDELPAELGNRPAGPTQRVVVRH
jgi:2-desacetyl-2-hydroxyethyl bacteriochlorophyllide A dehydrogenase